MTSRQTIGRLVGVKAFHPGDWVQVGNGAPWVVRESLDYDPGLVTGGKPPTCLGQAWRPYQVDYPSDHTLWNERQKRVYDATCKKD